MKKKLKLILVFVSLIIYVILLGFKKGKGKNEIIRIERTILYKKYESKIYKEVINNVVNDYSYKETKLEDNVESEVLVSYLEENQNNNIETTINLTNGENIDEIKNENINEENIIVESEEEVSNDLDNSVKNEEETIETLSMDNIVIEEQTEEDNSSNIIEENKGYYSPSGKYLGTNNIKVIDVSYYQGDINWDVFYNESDCYGVILRIGYYTFPDKKFEYNINEIKRLNIPYGIYLFSYATTVDGAKKEASFTNNMINKYDLKPTLGIYYDIESWTSKNSSSNIILNEEYDNIISTYINNVSEHVNNLYNVNVYSNRWYAENRLNNAKKYVNWVAEYNNTCKYKYEYKMWQYTSKGTIPGIIGNVDISYIL